MIIKENQVVQTDERVWCIDWHPSGKFMASAGSSKNFSIWKYSDKTLTKISTITTEHTKTIRSIKFSHGGDKLAIGSFDSSISVWVFNKESQEYEMISTLDGHENEVKCVSWSIDDQKLASCSRDKNIWIWDFDAISYDYVCDCVLEGHTQDVKYVEWFPEEENKLISTSYDNSIRIWQAEDDDYECKHILEGHKSIVWCVQIVGKCLFSCSEDCTVMQWSFNETISNYELKYVYEGIHTLPIYSLCILDNKYIVSGGADNWINLYKINQQEENGSKSIVPQIISKVRHDSDVNGLKIMKGDNTFASCSDDETVRVWEIVGI